MIVPGTPNASPVLSDTHPHSLFLFLLLFPGLMKQETNWVGLLAGLLETSLVWLFAISVTFRKTERTLRSRPRVTSP